ncbi:unnamed protein product [Mytilus edulis]|uniref:B box-type domain-containing protein n=1 Tax=Mytilus edulis TaxID=6550 RepID=A0A8S3UMI8_MYTED|nr:unnamed protein product [Mytilus edulis]
MSDDTLEREENQEVGNSPKPLRCRFHETEVYQIFCKDCKDFMCFQCIGQLHQKHELSQLQDADEAIRTEMCGLLLENKYADHLSSLSDKISDKEKELVQDEESLKSEIRTSVDELKQNIDREEKRLLFSEDSDSEWFDAEDIEEDDVIESSSDEITDEYPIKIQMNQDIKLISKIVPISEKDAWIFSNQKLLKIVGHSLQEDVYTENVDDMVALNDGCVLVLRAFETFIMKLLPNRRLVRFADVGYNPYCICIRDDIVVIYMWNQLDYTNKNHIIWMNTDGIVTKRSSFTRCNWMRPCSVQHLDSGVCLISCWQKL